MVRWVPFVLLLIAAWPVRADEALIRQVFEARYGVKVTQVSRAGYGGLYEVRVGDEILYTDDKVTYLLVGNLIDAKSRENVTEARREKISAIKWSELPLDAAIKTVRGNGKTLLAVFADPNCPFCKRFERELATLNNVTIYTFLYPILDSGNGGDSMRKSRAIWCANDRSKAWFDLMLRGELPMLTGNCDASALQRNLDLGKNLGISGTPTTFFASGQRIVGARSDQVRRAAGGN